MDIGGAIGVVNEFSRSKKIICAKELKPFVFQNNSLAKYALFRGCLSNGQFESVHLINEHKKVGTFPFAFGIIKWR